MEGKERERVREEESKGDRKGGNRKKTYCLAFFTERTKSKDQLNNNEHP